MPIDSQTEMAATTRRRKHWGWGYEDEQPSPEEVRAAAAGDRPACWASAPRSPSSRCRSRPWQLPEPRVELPARAGRDLLRGPATTAPRHAYGKAYRDVVRAFRGRFDHPPDVVAFPRDETDVERVLEWCESAGAAAIPYGGGTSVVGGVEPRFDGPGRLARPAPPRPRARGRPHLARRAHPGGRARPGARGAARRARADAAPLPPVLRVLHASAAGSPPAPAATSPRSTRTSTTSSSRSARSRRAGPGQSRRLPGSGAGPSPDRLLIGSEGTLGRHHRGVGAPPGPARAPRLGAACASRRSPPAPTPCGPSPSPACIPTNCRLLDPAEAQLTSGGRRRARAARARLRVGRPRPRARGWSARSSCAREHGGEWDDACARGGARGRGRAPGARRSCARPTCATPSCAMGVLSRDLRDRDHLGPLPRLPRDGDRRGAGGACARPAAPGRSPAASPTSTPTARRPTSRSSPPRAAARSSSSGRRSRRAASDAVIAAGGTITHHHAVGRDHRPWYDRQRPEPFAAALRGAKAAVDPDGILNPGVLVDPQVRPVNFFHTASLDSPGPPWARSCGEIANAPSGPPTEQGVSCP